MSHLDNLIEKFNGAVDIFYITPEAQAEIKSLRQDAIDWENQYYDLSDLYNPPREG